MTAPTTILDLLSRPCTAPTPGLAGYKIHHCRCAQCTAASNSYNQRRERLIAYGRWQPYVDAQPARDHINLVLRPSGLGVARIAALCGIPAATLQKLVWGNAGNPPSRRVRAGTDAAIRALRPAPGRVADGRPVDATGTRRRTEALACLGWPVQEQARMAGMGPANHHRRVFAGPTVSARCERAIRALFDRLQATPAPDGWVSRRTRAWAASRGFAPPLAWDDETIDDPAARSRGTRRPGRRAA